MPPSDTSSGYPPTLGGAGGGLARRITVALLDWYELMGVPWVELHATPEGEGLYRSLGFDEGPNPALRIRQEVPPPP